MPPKFASLNQAAVRRMIKESVDAAIAAKRARQANAGNNASGSRQASGLEVGSIRRIQGLDMAYWGFLGGRLRCKGVTKQRIGVPKGLALRVVLVDLHSNGKSRKGFKLEIIMANVIPPGHVDDLPVVEPNQPDDVPVIPKPADPLNLPPPASDSKPKDVIEVEDIVEPEDETVPTSVHKVDSFFGRIDSLSRRVCGRETAHALVEKKGKEKDKYYGKLNADLDNEVRSSVEEGAAAMEHLVRKLVQALEFYREMIRRGVVFEERPNEAIDVPVEDEESPSSEPRGSPISRLDAIGCNDLIMPPKSAPLNQAAVRRMIKESVDAAIATEQARQANAGNNASGSGQAKGQVTAHVVRECIFSGFMK
ncbi:hypothetical protein Tco_0831005 [Tanacetum coccineum]